MLSVCISKRIMAWATLGDLMTPSVVIHCTISSSSSMHNPKSLGNSRHPCFTLMSPENKLDCCPPIFTTHLTLLYILAIIVLYYVGTLSFLILSHSLS